MTAPDSFLGAGQFWGLSRSKITTARMQPASDPIGTRINKRSIARIPSPAFGCRGMINQPIKMLVKRPTKAPATIHWANNTTGRDLLLEGTGTSLSCRKSNGGLAENLLLVDRRRSGNCTPAVGWAISQGERANTPSTVIPTVWRRKKQWRQRESPRRHESSVNSACALLAS